LLQDVEELMERGRIEAFGDAEMAGFAQDQFQRDRGLEGLVIRGGRPRPGTDMDRQEGGRIRLSGEVIR
jgi:hypothetical protein